MVPWLSAQTKVPRPVLMTEVPAQRWIVELTPTQMAATIRGSRRVCDGPCDGRITA